MLWNPTIKNLGTKFLRCLIFVWKCCLDYAIIPPPQRWMEMQKYCGGGIHPPQSRECLTPHLFSFFHAIDFFGQSFCLIKVGGESWLPPLSSIMGPFWLKWSPHSCVMGRLLPIVGGSLCQGVPTHCRHTPLGVGVGFGSFVAILKYLSGSAGPLHQLWGAHSIPPNPDPSPGSRTCPPPLLMAPSPSPPPRACDLPSKEAWPGYTQNLVKTSSAKKNAKSRRLQEGNFNRVGSSKAGHTAVAGVLEFQQMCKHQNPQCWLPILHMMSPHQTGEQQNNFQNI